MPMKRAPRMMAALLLAALLTGCADPPRIILTTGFAQNEVVRVDQSSLTAQEILADDTVKTRHVELRVQPGEKQQWILLGFLVSK